MKNFGICSILSPEADPDPYPHQNEADPKDWEEGQLNAL